MVFAVHTIDFGSFFVTEVFDALQSFEVEFDPKAFILGIVEAVSVRPKNVHMSEGSRNATVRHGDGDLVVGFR